MKYQVFLLSVIICTSLLIVGCTDESRVTPVNPDVQAPATWLVPQSEVLDGGVGQDGIPSIDDPQFDLIDLVNPAFDDQLVVGIERNGVIHGYPIPIMDWHEIANDQVDDLNIAITYCPLTGTAIGWNRQLGSVLTTFGVSGLLYNSNLMPYDRRSQSIWSQQRLECVNGLRIGEKPESFSLIETSLATWRKTFPDALIMNANTGFDRRYSQYPYGDFRTNHDRLLFPVSEEDNRVPNKERVLGVIIDDLSKAYQFNQAGAGNEVIHDQIGTNSIVVIRSIDDNYNTAFLNTDNLTFEVVPNALPAVMKDQMDNYYDLAGRVVEGPDVGFKLQKPLSFIGYWYSWPAFYPEIELYEG